MDWDREWERLNPYQREAVTDEHRACLVSANVGSGKTTVLTAKIRYLHEVKSVNYRDMVVLTFTNKAADEIKERLVSGDPAMTAEETECFGTFHGVALKLLKNRLPVEKLGYTKDFMVMEPEEELELAHWLIAEHKLKIKYKNRLKKRLSEAERILGAGSEAGKEAGSEAGKEAGAGRSQDDLEILAGLLAEEKLKRNKMTFSDLMKNACLLMEKNREEENAGDFAGISWVIVDEVQDCDGKQLEFIDHFMAGGARLFAVGDPNQVIYSWRGSAFNLFYTLKNKYQAAELTLPVNYRSSSEILKAAQCFQQNGGALEGTRGSGEKIVVKNHYDSFQEACYLADRIRQLHEQGIPFGEIAVFYRLQSQSKVLEDVFSRNEIPYEVAVKKSIHEIPVLEWLLRLLRFLADPADRGAAVFVLGSREYGVGISAKKAEKLVAEWEKEKAETGKGLFDRMRFFRENSDEIKDTAGFYEYFKLDDSLKPNSAAYGEDRANVWHFLDRMFEYMEARGLGFPEGLREFLNSSALYGSGRELLPEKESGEADCVKMMTLHASKGLEFSHVFIIGVNYGLIPLRTRGLDGEDEERRLFFVGITRARNYLELSWYTNPDTFGVAAGESRYIRMIPAGLVLREGEEVESGPETELRPEERIGAGAANLQMLRRQIQLEKENGALSELNAPEQDSQEALPLESAPLVRHETYGCGRVIAEDDTMITVEFEGYGSKEFIKAFACLEILSD